jgi:VIT1/CCC1 family predicted Fe2+/Mn2+ transporter
MAHDALGAHARDELGLSEITRARPLQAAVASAAAFGVGAAPPVLCAAFVPIAMLTPIVSVSSLLLLGALGAVAASLGGAPVVRGAIRVVFWGAVALAASAAVGRLFGTTV